MIFLFFAFVIMAFAIDVIYSKPAKDRKFDESKRFCSCYDCRSYRKELGEFDE